jgi:hypothetical protein
MGPSTEPDAETRTSDEAATTASHSADRPGTDQEVAAAEQAWSESDPETRREVAEHEQEMMDIGANVKGEGEIA